jgi:hypothetical protein
LNILMVTVEVEDDVNGSPQGNHKPPKESEVGDGGGIWGADAQQL